MHFYLICVAFRPCILCKYDFVRKLILYTNRRAMSYTSGDIIRATGRKWFCDDDFRYSMDPNLRYSRGSVITMHKEWELFVGCLQICVAQCQEHGVRVTKQRAIHMQRDTPQQLELALFRAREEENRMRMCLNRMDLQTKYREFAEDGDHHNARMYHHFATSPDYIFDCYLSDDE